MGTSAVVGPPSGVVADEHDASITSVTAGATINRTALTIMARPYVQAPHPQSPSPPDLGVLNHTGSPRVVEDEAG